MAEAAETLRAIATLSDSIVRMQKKADAAFMASQAIRKGLPVPTPRPVFSAYEATTLQRARKRRAELQRELPPLHTV